ncbi:MAG TPA: hypothetical protein VFH78_01750 [Candidatus Thermoplasmatota archaeon]|nr:hypothetical protein [Candidatus Thermoplasmatota archaeon]
MADAITGIVRVIHIVTSVAWVGGALLWGNIIAPRVLQRGPPQIRRPFAEAVIPAMTRYYMIVASLAILSGLVLVGQIWGWGNYGQAFQEPTGGYGLWLGIGAVSAIVMAIIGFGIIAPTGKKLVAFMGTMNGPPTPEQQAQLGAMGKKLGIMGMLVMLFGTVAAVGMAMAVNVFRG